MKRGVASETVCPDSISENAVASLEELRDKVLSNDVVWWNLGQLLSLSDLKDCRLVSSSFNRKVMDSTDFKNRSIIKLREKDFCADVFGKTAEKWKNLSLPVHESMSDDYEDEDKDFRNLNLGSLLNKLEFLDLRHEGPYLLLPYVAQFLKAPAKLQSLSIDLDLLGLRGGESFLRTCQGVLHNIRELKFGSRRRGYPHVIRLVRRLEELASCATNLSVLLIDKDCMSHWFEQSTLPVVELVKNNRLRLQILELGCNFWGNIESSLINNAVAFPVLKKLRIEACTIIPEKLGEFLRAHASLQDLHIMFTREINVPLTSLLAVVQENGERLKTLRISTTYSFLNDEAVDVLLLLATLKLEKFELCVDGPYVSNDNSVAVPLASFLSNFSSTIRSVSFHSCGFRIIDTQIISTHFAKIDPLKLTVLCLSGHDSGVTDVTAEFICRNLKMLQKLDLSGSECTDYGFTGIRPGSNASPEFSLANLKRLKSLTLKSCYYITDYTLVFGVRFAELTHLDVEDSWEFAAHACLRVLRQNPSLEIFTVSMSEYEEEEVPAFDELRVIAPRLKRLNMRIVYEDSDSEDASSGSGEDEEDEASHSGEEEEEEDDWHSAQEEVDEDEDRGSLGGENSDSDTDGGSEAKEDEDDDGGSDEHGGDP